MFVKGHTGYSMLALKCPFFSILIIFGSFGCVVDFFFFNDWQSQLVQLCTQPEEKQRAIEQQETLLSVETRLTLSPSFSYSSSRCSAQECPPISAYLQRHQAQLPVQPRFGR